MFSVGLGDVDAVPLKDEFTAARELRVICLR